jgi:hypothetical protein
MARTTPAAVEEVLIDDYDSINTPSLEGFIETASAIVDRVVECATRKGTTLSTAEKELIERWLSAHLYGMSDQPYKARSTLRASGQFQGETGMYLEATKYGQMAVVLDPSGCLNNLGKKNKVRAFWIGKRPSEQTDYEDRD